MNPTVSKPLFANKTEAYTRYRPSYPIEAINQILNPFHNITSPLALDIGAGTGVSSRLLAERGAKVIAVEPNQSALRLADIHDDIVWEDMNAENLNVKSNSADLVTSFQAFQWFRFRKSLKEFNRVLRPGGRLALVWSYWDKEDRFTANFVDLINKAAKKNPDRVSPYGKFPSGWIKKIMIKLLWKFLYLPFFKKVKKYRYDYYQDADLKTMIGIARSQDALLHDGEVWEQLVEDIEKLSESGSNLKLAYTTYLFTAKPKYRAS